MADRGGDVSSSVPMRLLFSPANPIRSSPIQFSVVEVQLASARPLSLQPVVVLRPAFLIGHVPARQGERDPDPDVSAW